MVNGKLPPFGICYPGNEPFFNISQSPKLTSRKDIWNNRYANRPPGLPPPHHYLVRNLAQLQPGSVLDLACGLGNNAIYLAQQGYQVIAVDFASEALRLLANFQKEGNLKIQILELDLSDPQNINQLPKTNNVIAFRYLLPMDLLEAIPKLMKSPGLFLYCTYNMEHHRRTGFPEKHCLSNGELAGKSWNMELISCDSFVWSNAHYDGYVFKKA